MSENSSEPGQEHPSGRIEYATPPLREAVGRSAIAALVLGIVSLGAMLWGLCGPNSVPTMRGVLLILSTVATIGAIPAGIVAIRKAAKENGAGRKQARVGLVLAGVTVVMGLILFWLLDALNSVHSRDDQIRCQSRVKIIGQAMLQYANDHNGQFPQNFSQLFNDVAPEIFVCPASMDQRAIGSTTQQVIADFAKPGRCSYIYLGAGSSVSSVPKNFVLAYEPLDNHEKEGAHFVFGDASVEWLEAKDAQKLIDQLTSGVNPPKR
jgi:hypothetical protein